MIFDSTSHLGYIKYLLDMLIVEVSYGQSFFLSWIPKIIYIKVMIIVLNKYPVSTMCIKDSGLMEYAIHGF
jgi:flagellar biosynthesis protein FliQ